MIGNNLCIINSEKYDITNKDDINIFSVKKNHLDTKIVYSNYKIILKFIKKTYVELKIGISMNLKKIKCKFAEKEYEINNVKHFKLEVNPEDIFEIDLDSVKKHFEIYVKINDIDGIIYNNKNELDISIDNSIIKNNLKSVPIKKVIVVLSKFIESIGSFFNLIFESKGLECEIIFSLPLINCIESTPEQMYLIVYSDQTHLALPSRYIFYQVEQSNSKFLTDPKLLKRTVYMMIKAEQVWEYSTLTRPIYLKYCENKLKWVPMPYYYIENVPEHIWDSCEYDIFFYGHPNPRRKTILNMLGKYFKVKEGWGYYGEKKINYIKKSKIILNLHYYRDAGLETCRINEILNLNKLIISESSPLDTSNIELYKEHVVFVDEIDDNFSNIKQLVKTIKYYLVKDNYLDKIKNSDKINLCEKISNKILSNVNF